MSAEVNTANPGSQLHGGVVRVFISSTFRDMHAERDHLVTVVFPELRERCESLGLEFFDVDLRWGVPEKGADGEKANSWEYCRQWIERVEPLFVCILGQRYGWVPKVEDFKDDQDKARQVAEHRSITDLEVRHAVLDSRRKRRSYFYLRAADAPSTAIEYVDPPPLSNKLEQLKADIRSCGRPVRDYPCEWEGGRFAKLDAFGKMVLEDLWSGVLRDERYVSKEVWRQVLGTEPDSDSRYTDETQPVPRELWEKLVKAAKPPPKDPLEAEREQMEAFAASRLRWFQGRTKELEQLTEFIHSTDSDAPRLAVVAAVPGQGKSALIAKLSERIQESEFRSQEPKLLITHFVGATERSASAHALVERLLGELDHSGIQWPAEEQKEGEEPKRDFNGLCLRLAQRISDYVGERQIVILLDALNQLSDGHDLNWLPHRLGPSVRVVVSCVEDPNAKGDGPERKVLRALDSRQPAPLRVPLGALTEDDVRTIVVAYLKEYCKELDTPLVDVICRMEQARNPLYLLVMLGELRTLGGNDMNKIVGELISAMPRDYPDTVSLFRWVLKRLEVFNKDVPDAAQWWCLYLAHGRVGMASKELADLLAQKLGGGAAATALRIERGLRRYLLRRGAQLDFFHGQLRRAVMEQYGLRAESAAIHGEIADYFRRLADSERNGTWLGPENRPFEQLPYHLAGAFKLQELREILSDLAFLDARILLSGPMSLLSDYMSAHLEDAIMDSWCAFILSHASLLRMVPTLLPSLVWHAGPPELRQSVDAYLKLGIHRHTWLKLDALAPVQPPVQKSEDVGPEAPRFEILASSDEIRTSVAAIAVARSAGLYLKRTGHIGVVDFRNGRVSDHDVRHPSMERLLTMAASADGRWLALVDEKGKGVCLELAWLREDEFHPAVVSEKMFTCLLPEYENPAVLLDHDCLWWQDDTGHLSSWKVGSTESRQMVRLRGELRSLCRHDADMAALDIACEQASVIVFDSNCEVQHRHSIPWRIQKMCACHGEGLLFLTQEGATHLLSRPTYENGRPGPSVSGVVTTMGSIPGGILFELTDRTAFWTGKIDDPLVPLPPFKLGSGHILALAEVNDSLYAVKMASAFRAQRLLSKSSASGPAREMRIHALGPDISDTSYSALVEANSALFATGPAPQPVYEFGKASAKTQAVANRGQLAWPESAGKLALWTPPQPPSVVKVSGVGEILFLAAGAHGEYWLTNDDSEIWWIDAQGQGRKLASVQNIERPMPHRLLASEEWVVWCGTSMGDRRRHSADHLDTVVFFKITGDADNRKLQPMGHHYYAPENGRWTLTLWDVRTGELACFFQLLGKKRFLVRVGTPSEVLLGQERVVDLTVPEMLARDLEAGTSFADGRGWLVFTRGGWLVGLESGTFRMLGAYPLGVLGGIATQAREACLVISEGAAVASCSIWDKTTARQSTGAKNDD